jgi:hypothetical protein
VRGLCSFLRRGRRDEDTPEKPEQEVPCTHSSAR